MLLAITCKNVKTRYRNEYITDFNFNFTYRYTFFSDWNLKEYIDFYECTAQHWFHFSWFLTFFLSFSIWNIHFTFYRFFILISTTTRETCRVFHIRPYAWLWNGLKKTLLLISYYLTMNNSIDLSVVFWVWIWNFFFIF